MGWYKSNPCTLLFDFLAAPASLSFWSGAKRYCRFLEVSEALRASCTAERHRLVTKYFHRLNVLVSQGLSPVGTS